MSSYPNTCAADSRHTAALEASMHKLPYLPMLLGVPRLLACYHTRETGLHWGLDWRLIVRDPQHDMLPLVVHP